MLSPLLSVALLGLVLAEEKYDWIVVGGGAAGSTAAATLADTGASVLVLERGRSDVDEVFTANASGWPAVLNTDATERIRFKEGVWGMVANVLGGGGAIGAGVVVNEECEWFRKEFGIANCTAITEAYQWASSQLASPLAPSPDLNKHWETVMTDFFTTTFTPASLFNTSADGWPRLNPANLLHRRKGLGNLKVETRSVVHRVHIEGGAAKGVWVERRGQRLLPELVTAVKGVVLACGAVLTPKILHLSGVGARRHLTEVLRREVVVDNGAVGQGFVDQNMLTLGFLSEAKIGQSVGYTYGTRSSVLYGMSGGGHILTEQAKASMALVAPEDRTVARREEFLTIFGRKPNADNRVDRTFDNTLEMVALNRNTRSVGSVEASSDDPLAPPTVSANYFSDAADMAAMVQAVQTMANLSEADPLGPFRMQKFPFPFNVTLPSWLECSLSPETGRQAIPYVVFPCPPVNTTAQAWEAWVTKHVASSYHYFGGAALGKVVDSETFKVSSVDRLFVVDSSVFPVPTTVHPLGSVLAVARYAAQILLSNP